MRYLTTNLRKNRIVKTSKKELKEIVDGMTVKELEAFLNDLIKSSVPIVIIEESEEFKYEGNGE